MSCLSNASKNVWEGETQPVAAVTVTLGERPSECGGGLGAAPHHTSFSWLDKEGSIRQRATRSRKLAYNKVGPEAAGSCPLALLWLLLTSSLYVSISACARKRA